MSTTTKVASRRDAEAVLRAVKRQFKNYVESGCEPQLIERWSFLRDSDHWAVVWEEGPYDWAHLFPYGGREEEFGSLILDVSADVPARVFCEPITGWALGVYPDRGGPTC